MVTYINKDKISPLHRPDIIIDWLYNENRISAHLQNTRINRPLKRKKDEE